MDLRSLMNNDSSEAARPPPSRDAQQRNSIQPPPPPARTASSSYGSPPPPQHNQYAPKPTPPLYQQSPASDSRASNGSIAPPRLTPLHTPTQTPGQLSGGGGGTAGYPFPTAPYQSPSQGQQYRAHEGYQVVTPGGTRPPAPLYQYGGQPASSPYGAPPPQAQPQAQAQAAPRHSVSHSTMSPTPPTLHQQTPQPRRESPMSYAHHPYPVNNHHPSQPSTPLGPPSAVQYPRGSAQAQSPYGNIHHRSSSGASHGPPQSVASNSPAQARALGHISESQPAYGQPGQIKRTVSGGYPSESERERSLSVSPKTRVVPRQGSQGSYYSNQDPISARNSVPAASQQEPERTSHQTQSQHEPHQLRSSGDMSHGISPLTTTRPAPTNFQAPPAPSPSSRSSQTPKLKNLLNDSTMVSSPIRPSPGTSQSHDYSPHSQPSATNATHANDWNDVGPRIEPSSVRTSESGFPQESLLQQPVANPASQFTPAQEALASHSQQQPVILKRPAGDTPEAAHPVKRVKKRYAEPPIWARYSRSNPRYGDNPQSLAPPPQQQVKRPSPQSQISRGNPGQMQPNGHGQQQPVANGTPSGPVGGMPQKIIPRLGPWEYNIKNVQPMNDFLKEVGDFLIFHATRSDIGAGDLRSGALEIEAKLGTLIDRQTNSRVATLGTTNMVLDHAVTNSGRIRFESFMTEVQHKQMNDYLNNAVQRSMEPHRVKMGYKHRYERDSFAALNRAGYEALPPTAKAHLRPGHTLKLRTTNDTKAPPGHPQYVIGPVLGRIVKVRLDDLDIHCPKMDFDCRISVNVEVDLNNRPDVDPALIVEEPNSNEPNPASERNKDRLSYQHLAYSVDLTQVTLPNGKKTHELEIEIDSAKLREEALRCVQGLDNAYETLVDGLLSNVLTLMKAHKEGAPVQGGPPQHGR